MNSLKCGLCSRLLNEDSGFLIAGQRRCLACALAHPRLLYRSFKTAAVVGTVLVLINLGPSFLAGELSYAALWKVPLNYLVPFCVSTWGALGKARSNR